ncbi:GNAT family N-acetyltransferase [Flavobacterium sp.]|uniref:GNAT family N-acetyltransferase n=1 Tax=Flavobacterium sp. TaxID=239 RepID=UPI002487E0D8|nr:GNAT family N-acetyltransferase [Flavobacterium sp.]MDI1316509.1 GNAT family N-acetyltransferase [Flavobacterium sp.]
MKNYTVRRYTLEDYAIWNAFISAAKNATFLFHRDFMEYHKDRFEDFSLLVFENGKLVSVLPANRVGATVYSHQGLTYGGLVLLPKSKLYDTIYLFQSVLKFLSDNGVSKLFLKQIPSIYCRYSSDEINYLAHICKGEVVMKHNVSVVTLNQDRLISKSRRECVNRGKKLGLEIREDGKIDLFWNELLIPNLSAKYNSKPVHSVAEITKLMNNFPDNIRHFNVYNDSKLVCGTTIFITDKVVKPQYISGNENNNELGSIDFLYDFLINDVAKGKDYFDFGPSHENNGLQIVKNINFWKESFGAHSLIQDFYEIKTSNFEMLDSILI